MGLGDVDPSCRKLHTGASIMGRGMYWYDVGLWSSGWLAGALISIVVVAFIVLMFRVGVFKNDSHEVRRFNKLKHERLNDPARKALVERVRALEGQ